MCVTWDLRYVNDLSPLNTELSFSNYVRCCACHEHGGLLLVMRIKIMALQWCHIEHDGISNHQRLDYLLNRVLRYRSKKISKLRFTGLCEGNSLVTGEFPTQRASNVENVSIWINGWVNSLEAGDSRCHCAHYDINLMRKDSPRLCNILYVDALCLKWNSTEHQTSGFRKLITTLNHQKEKIHAIMKLSTNQNNANANLNEEHYLEGHKEIQ